MARILLSKIDCHLMHRNRQIIESIFQDGGISSDVEAEAKAGTTIFYGSGSGSGKYKMNGSGSGSGSSKKIAEASTASTILVFEANFFYLQENFEN